MKGQCVRKSQGCFPGIGFVTAMMFFLPMSVCMIEAENVSVLVLGMHCFASFKIIHSSLQLRKFVEYIFKF